MNCLQYGDTIGQYFLPLYPIQQCSMSEHDNDDDK